MGKVYVKDIHEKDQVKSVFQVSRKTPTVAKSGKPFLAVSLRDKTGELDARIWTRVEELDAKFSKGDYVEAEGPVTLFQGKPQLRIDSIERISAEGLDIADFAAPPKAEPGERFFVQIVEIIDRIHDPHIKALLKSFTDDEALAAEFKRAPAAKTIHHAYPGGLAEHTLSVMKLGLRISDHYPMADRDLLIAGGFLHDIGKVKELTFERQTEYTDEGRLIGHLVIASQWIGERASKIEGFPKPLETHLMHLVLSHHGTLEFGSARLPQTVEAMLLHVIDEMDSRLSSWLEAMKRDSGENWTDFQKLYDRHLYKGASATVSAKLPVERHRKRERTRRERGDRAADTAAAPSSPGQAPTQTREQPHERQSKSSGAESQPAAATPAPEQPATENPNPLPAARPAREKREKPGKKAEEKLTFKPFAALVAAAEAMSLETGGDAHPSAVDDSADLSATPKAAPEAVSESAEPSAPDSQPENAAPLPDSSNG